MKKWIIGTVVGAILTFAWQTISWTALDLHRNAQQYTPKQDSILQFLGTQFTESGDYFMPNLPEGASAEEHEKLMNTSAGKPWAKISYHTSWEASMTANIIRGFLVNLIMVAFMVWILMKMNAPSFSTILRPHPALMRRPRRAANIIRTHAGERRPRLRAPPTTGPRARSEERRVGNSRRAPCRSRWSPDH